MNKPDKKKNSYKLQGRLTKRGFVRWFHAFRGIEPNRGEVRTFFVEYQLLNPGMGSGGLTLNCPDLSGQNPSLPSYIQVKAGVFPTSSGGDGLQITNFYSVGSIQFCNEPFLFQFGDCFYSENHIRGNVQVSDTESMKPYLLSNAGSMEWDLEVHKAVACNMGLITDPPACALGAMTCFWHAEGLRTCYRGRVILNGESYDVDPSVCYGYADKSWGKQDTRPLFLLTSSHLVSSVKNKEYKNSVFAVRGCFPKLFFIPLKYKLMIQLTHMGEDFEFHFAGIRNFSLSKWSTKATNKRRIWHIKASNRNAVIKISVTCTKKDLLDLLHDDPCGRSRRCQILCNANGLGTIRLYKKSGRELELIDCLKAEDVFCSYGS